MPSTPPRPSSLLFLLPAALLLAGPPAAARAAPTEGPPVQVRLASLGSPERFTARGAGKLRVLNGATGELLEEVPGTLAVAASGKQVKAGTRAVPSLRLESEAVTVTIGKTARSYPGALLVLAAGGKLSLVNECSLESYTAGVLAGECPASFHPEAIRAMAIAARSYSVRKALVKKVPGREGLCDTTHCHVYRGLDGVRPSIREAVRATAGLCVLYEGEPIDAVYSADCGGYTEANEEAWPGTRPLPYLRAVEDAPGPGAPAYCSINRSHAWSLPLPLERLKALFGKPVERVKLLLSELTGSGRARRLTLAPPEAAAPEGEPARPDPPAGPGEAVRAGAAGFPPAAGAAGILTQLIPRIFRGDEWRRALGATVLRSLRFELRETEAGVELHGRGYGHGVGLCQFGAHGMALQGATCEQILKHYYTGVEIGSPAALRQHAAR